MEHLISGQELQAVAVPLHAEVEAAQPVSTEAIGSAAHHNGPRLVHFHHLSNKKVFMQNERIKLQGMFMYLGHHRLIQHLVAVVIHSIFQRHIDRVVFALQELVSADVS